MPLNVLPHPRNGKENIDGQERCFRGLWDVAFGG